MNKKILYPVLVLLSVVGLLATSCAQPSPASSPVPAPTSKPAPAPAPATPVQPEPKPTLVPTPKPTATPTPVPVPKPALALRVGISSFGNEQLDPIKEIFTGSAAFSQGTIFDALVGTSPDGKLSKELGIARDWEMASDGLSWKFYIRDGVKFHDGTPLTAEDVKFSLERFTSKDSKSSYAGTLRQAIKSIEIVGGNAVVVHTNGVWPYFLYAVAPVQASEGMVMPKRYIETRGAADFARNPVGSGPYKFVKHVPGDRIEMEAVENYWRESPGFKSLTIMLVPEESTRVAMLKTGKLDLIEVSGERAAEVEAAKFEVRSIQNSLFAAGFFVGADLPEVASTPIAKVKVRQALSLAINRQEIIKYIIGGRGTMPGVFPIWSFAADVDGNRWTKWAAENYVYNPEKALALLKEAGYPQGFSIKYFSFPASGTPWLPAVNEAIAGYWNKIGVKVEIVPIDYGAFRTQIQAKDPKVMGQAWSFRTSTKVVVPQTARTWFRSGELFWTLSNPENDKLIDGIPKEADNAKRFQMMNESIRIMAESWTCYPIAYADALYATSNKVGEWQPVAGHGYLGLVYATIKPPKK